MRVHFFEPVRKPRFGLLNGLHVFLKRSVFGTLLDRMIKLIGMLIYEGLDGFRVLLIIVDFRETERLFGERS